MRFGGGPGLVDAGQPEVQHFRIAVAANHHVLGLDVAMDDAGSVRSRKRLRDLPADVDHRRRRVLSLHARAQRRAVDEFLDDVVAAVIGLADVVDHDDVGVIEGRGGASFSKEALDGESAVPLGVAHQLDGNRAPQPGVHGAVDLAHSPAADHLFEAVVIDGRWQHLSARWRRVISTRVRNGQL